MKKIISVVLSVLMLMSVFSVAVAAEEQGFSVTVANDLHYNIRYTSDATAKKNKVDTDFAHVGTSTRLPNEAFAIIKAFLEKAGENDSDYVLIPGDITEAGKAEEHVIITELFRNFEKTYGKEIYVVPGNHDFFNGSVASFKEIYKEFGYDEAILVDDDTASYVVDLPNNYRLLAIDSCVPGISGHGIDENRLQWIEAQGEKAREDGKKLIAMMHHNLLEHMILASVIHSTAMVSAKVKNAPEVFAKADIKYIFTGHTHDHDIASYTAEDGTVIYDIVTGSLNGTDSLYREVTFGDEVKVETKSIEKLDISLLPVGISENALKLAESDFRTYNRRATDLSYALLFNSYTTAKGLKSVLKLEDEEMNVIIDKVGGRLNEALNMPLLKKNETVKGKSIEHIVQQYETFLPETDYENMIDLAVTVYQAHNVGDENYPAYSPEVITFTRGLAAVLSYTLSEVSAEEYAKVLSFVAGLLDVNIPVNFLTYAGDGIKRFEGAEIFVTTAILPVLAEFLVDDAPGDCNVTLPGYAELVEDSKENFFDKIIAFFKMLLDAARTIFAFVPSWNK